MAKAGWCDIEGANVWLNEDGSDVNGHDASHISNVYEAGPAPTTQGDAEFQAQAGQVADDVGQGLTEAGQQLGGFAKQAWAWGKQQAKSDDPGPGPGGDAGAGGPGGDAGAGGPGA